MKRELENELEVDQRADRAQQTAAEVPQILLVDDDDAICDVLMLALTEAGFVVTCAHNSAEARRVLNRDGADVVVLDVCMPGENGLFLAEYADAMGAAVILMTSHPDTMSVLDNLNCRRLDKPFHLADFIAAVRETARPRGSATSGS